MSGNVTSGSGDGTALDRAVTALSQLAAARPEVADPLLNLISVAADELTRNATLARRLVDGSTDQSRHSGKPAVKRARREPGPWDPFAVYAEKGETVLRDRLLALKLEELRNIVAEHGMDTDRLAMKWRDPERVVGRIVERVRDRAAKGEQFRTPKPPAAP